MEATWAQRVAAQRLWRESLRNSAAAGVGAAKPVTKTSSFASRLRGGGLFDPSSPSAERKSHGESKSRSGTRTFSATSGGRASDRADGAGGGGASPGARAEGRKDSDAGGSGSGSGAPGADAGAAPAAADFAPPTSAEALEKVKEVELQLRALMSAPMAERKQYLRDLMLAYHPDKNNDAIAKDVFQFINASRAWFLLGAA